MQCTMGSGTKPQKLGNFREFFVKSNLTVCKAYVFVSKMNFLFRFVRYFQLMFHPFFCTKS